MLVLDLSNPNSYSAIAVLVLKPVFSSTSTSTSTREARLGQLQNRRDGFSMSRGKKRSLSKSNQQAGHGGRAPMPSLEMFQERNGVSEFFDGVRRHVPFDNEVPSIGLLFENRSDVWEFG